MINPLFNRVIMRELEDVEIDKQTLVIPSTAENNLTRGVVLAVGADCRFVKVSDIVLYPPNGGEEVYIDNEVVRIILETDVLAVI